MKTPTPTKAAENQKEKGKSGVITDLFNTKGGKKKEKKRNIKQGDQLKANGRVILHCVYIPQFSYPFIC